MRTTRAKRLVLTAQLAIVGLVLFFVGRAVARLWPEMAARAWHISSGLLLASLATGIACQGLLVAGWRLSLGLVGARIGWAGAIESQIVGQLAKYVPGKVLTLVGKAYLAARAGVPESQATLAMFVEAAAQVVTGLAVGLAYVAAVLPQERRLLPIAALVVVLMALSLHPAVLPRAIGAGFRLAGREPVELRYEWSRAVPLVGCYLLLWCGWGLGCWLLALGLGLRVAIVPLAAGYALSWVAGFLSFIFPGGLGVREYALARLLGAAADSGAAMSIALASRAWILAAELLCVACVWGHRIAIGRRPGPPRACEEEPDGEG